jgi:hypothetical protein
VVKLNRTVVVALAALVIAVVVGIGVLAQRESPVGQSSSPQSATVAAIPSTTIAPTACAEVLAPGQAYRNYENVRGMLAAGRVDAAGLDDRLACFTGGDAPGLGSEQLYQKLLKASFHANVYYDFLAEEMANVLAQAQQDQARRSRWLAWQGSYAAEGALLAYRRTGETRFLDLFSGYFDNVLNLRDSQLGLTDQLRGRVMPAWGDGDELEGLWIAHVTQAARITYPATEFARIVRSDPALDRFVPNADRYVAAAVAAMAAFDEDYRPIPGEGLSYFIRPGKNREEPTNHAHQVGRVYLNLYELTGDRTYQDRAAEILMVFKKGLRYDTQGYMFWSYFPYFSKEKENVRNKAEHIWKASLTAPFVYMAYQRDMDAPKQLVEKIAETFLANVLVNNELGRELTGDGKVDQEDVRLNQAYGFVSWLDYSPLRPEIAERTRHIVATRRDLFPKGWFYSTNLARGYAFFLPQSAPLAAAPTANDDTAGR